MINMLGRSRLNPKNSEYAMMEVNFDFNKKTLASPGTKVTVNKKLTEGTHGYIFGYKAGT